MGVSAAVAAVYLCPAGHRTPVIVSGRPLVVDGRPVVTVIPCRQLVAAATECSQRARLVEPVAPR